MPSMPPRHGGDHLGTVPEPTQRRTPPIQAFLPPRPVRSPLCAGLADVQPWVMNNDLDRPVVVGIDGSSSAASALDAAAAEAVALGVPLRIVHAYAWPIFYAALANLPYRPGDWEPAPAIRAMVNATATRVASEHPGLAVRTSVMAGGGGAVLVAASAAASVVVVGGRGVGGLAGLMAGSVAPHVASHAHCPVIVVHEGQTTAAAGGHVTVGVDGTSSSLRALRFACDWARRRGAEVEAVHAVDSGRFDEPVPEFDRTPAEVRIDGWVDGVRQDFPTLQVRSAVVRASATQALMAASRSARLIVVGSRHRGEIASLVLGSVGHELMRRSACPVAVAHGVSAEISGRAPPIPGGGGRVRLLIDGESGTRSGRYGL